MSEDKLKNIPVLEDVVEIGATFTPNDVDESGNEENAEGERSPELFDLLDAEERAADETGDAAPTQADAGDAAIAAENSVETGLLHSTADAVEPPPVDTVPGTGEDDRQREIASMWIDDWQEDSRTTVLSDDDTVYTAPTEAAPNESAVIGDTRGLASEETVAPAAEPALDAARIAAITDDIVQRVLPEIEWKLRNHVREVLEERFGTDDETS